MGGNYFGSALLCIAVALSGCASASLPARTGRESTEVQIRAAISKAWRDHIDAAKRKDLVGVMAIYAQDAAYVVPGATEARGHSAINMMETQGLAAADVLDATHTTRDLRIFEDIAYEIGTVAGPVRAKGGVAQTITFHFMGMWRRQGDGTWRLTYLVGQPEATGSPR
jgi:ketosteroid isomerase-like protein